MLTFIYENSLESLSISFIVMVMGLTWTTYGYHLFFKNNDMHLQASAYNKDEVDLVVLGIVFYIHPIRAIQLK